MVRPRCRGPEMQVVSETGLPAWRLVLAAIALVGGIACAIAAQISKDGEALGSAGAPGGL